jgi:hypothetical protein
MWKSGLWGGSETFWRKCSGLAGMCGVVNMVKHECGLEVTMFFFPFIVFWWNIRCTGNIWHFLSMWKVASRRESLDLTENTYCAWDEHGIQLMCRKVKSSSFCYKYVLTWCLQKLIWKIYVLYICL